MEMNKLKNGIYKNLKVVPHQKQIEYKKKKDVTYQPEEYMISGLYDIKKITALIENSEKFEQEVGRIKQIILDYGKNAVFTPVISKKAMNDETNRMFIRLQREAGLNRITVMEGNSSQTIEEMQDHFKEYLEDKDVFFLLDCSMSYTLLVDKLKRLKEIGLEEVGINFVGFWKYIKGLLSIMGLDKKQRPKITMCNVWEKLQKVPLPIIVGLLNVEKIGCGFKWGMSKPVVKKPIDRLNQERFLYEPLTETQTRKLKESIHVEDEDELYSYLRLESHEKNIKMIEKLSKMEFEKMVKELEDKNVLSFIS